MRLMPFLLLASLLAGCATLDENSCRTRDATSLGRDDGHQGYGLWRLDKHIEACGRYGITLDRQAYLAGRAEGLQSYCTPENGQRVGERGERYEGVCPANLEPGFLRRYWPAYWEYRQDYPEDFWPGGRMGVGVGEGPRGRFGFGLGIGF